MAILTSDSEVRACGTRVRFVLCENHSATSSASAPASPPPRPGLTPYKDKPSRTRTQSRPNHHLIHSGDFHAIISISYSSVCVADTGCHVESRLGLFC
ncbi:unnamed protein product [Danaus chrysippus]|uniref:(African queen) hypothetical protein n=1 Tax=Danaus chrysippus TaxID=151541 RepID=A0A8J2VW03_9NEOP|nr:unnamed protein product [Danaus chrysippus]